jgi:hypothetical protein
MAGATPNPPLTARTATKASTMQPMKKLGKALGSSGENGTLSGAIVFPRAGKPWKTVASPHLPQPTPQG